MNALRMVLNSLQKYASTITPTKNDVNVAIPLLPEKRSLHERDLEKEIPGSEIYVNAATSLTMDTNECLKEFIPLLPEKRSLEETDLHKEIPGSEIYVNSATSLTLDTNECLKEFIPLLPEKRSLEETDLHKEIPGSEIYVNSATSLTLDTNECLKEFIPLLPEKRSLEETDLEKEIPGSEIYVNIATSLTMDTNECLKEFDDILEEKNKDVSKGASLADIDDVLKDMAQDNTKDLMFEVPRFDLAEISAAYENVKDEDVDINSLLSLDLDESVVSLSDDYISNSNEFIQQNDVISIISEDSQPEGSVKDISTENTANIEQSIDVNSTNTETKENLKHSESVNIYIGTEKNQCIEKQTSLHVATNEVIDKTNKPTDITNECIQNNPAESTKEENDLTTEDVVFIEHRFIDSDDCGYQSSDFEFITEEEANMDGLIINIKENTLKRKVAKVNHFSNAKKSQRRNKIKRNTRKNDKDPDWAPESDTDSISDDDIIPDDREYLSIIKTRSKNNNTSAKSPWRNNTITFGLRQVRLPPKTNNGCPRFRNSHISSDIVTSRNITAYNVNVVHNNERDNLDRNIHRDGCNESRNDIAISQMECNAESKLLRTETDHLELSRMNYPNAKTQGLPGLPIKIIPGRSFMQENRPDSINMVMKTNEMLEGPEVNNIPILISPEKNNFDPGSSHSQRPEEIMIPGTSTENVPDPNYLRPGPSRMQEIPKLDHSGPELSFKRNRSKIDEIEKWRMYQMRTRENRRHFVIDYSYRDHHRIYQDNDLHQLFDPNRAPLPTARSIRLLENKSTVCKNSMLVEYQGVGFDVPRGSGSEDDEVKREAYECAQKILEIYPEQNTRRLRRRRF